MDQFLLIAAIQEHSKKQKAANIAGEKENDNNLWETSESRKKTGDGKGTMLDKMGKTFDEYAENASEHYEDKGMRMGPPWL